MDHETWQLFSVKEKKTERLALVEQIKINIFLHLNHPLQENIK